MNAIFNFGLTGIVIIALLVFIVAAVRIPREYERGVVSAIR